MSEVLDPPMLTSRVGAAIDALGSFVEDVVGLTAVDATTQLWGLSSAELLEATAALHTLTNRLDAALHAMVREVDVRAAAIEAGAPSTAGWLSQRLRLHPANASRLVSTARTLHDDPAGPLVPHATDDWPDDLDDDRRDDEDEGHDECDDECNECEEALDASARQRPRARLRAAFAAGRLTDEQVATVCQALTAIARLEDVDPDTELRAERFLVRQARLHNPKALRHLGTHLRHVLDPNRGEELAKEEDRAAEQNNLDVRMKADGGSRVAGHLDAETTAALLTHLDPLSAPRPAADGTRDLRTAGQRRAEALGELLRRYAQAESGPTRHGTHTTVAVTINLQTLMEGLGSVGAWLDWSGPISAATARRLACDARIIPVVLSSTGEPLDVGRASYPVTQAIWRALVVRDGGCAFAGCDRPPEWCDAHHLQHWADGGATSVDNCVLLCGFHHRLTHRGGWSIELRDGQAWTIPPRWVDPTQTPRPNTQRSRLADPQHLSRTMRPPPRGAPAKPQVASRDRAPSDERDSDSHHSRPGDRSDPPSD